ncbi:MAG: 16S rRNA (cytosine(1402)-N(4))-methyltransferase RsmH [Puniceicoccales bacterium]|jgi:16S rRNA (cytosine1402-N4)-methyltransferase|nr:16S rRNA (cytosine(1402)-N(4))-methyltransferase RsmH [Puniceicoccales bacterium]
MTQHISVLSSETLGLLKPERGGAFLDATFGGGGHTRALLKASPHVRVYALDKDPQAELRAATLATEFGERLHFTRTRFSRLDAAPGAPYDGILMDIGLSSYQLDEAARGFSFREEADAPADMRMDPDDGSTAADFLEDAPDEKLVEAVRDLGGEPAWRRVVQAILKARGTGKLARTASLATLIAEAVYRPGPPSRIHPATRTFQGIRIAINDELGELRTALPKAFASLRPSGVLAVISFHSLEDRITKRFFREICGLPVDARDSRTQDMRTRQAILLTRSPISPGEEEIARNPRSRSARLRAVSKLGEEAGHA